MCIDQYTPICATNLAQMGSKYHTIHKRGNGAVLGWESETALVLADSSNQGNYGQVW